MNDDSIKRKSVIATIEAMFERCTTYDIIDYKELMLEAVEVLPSADKSGAWITVWDECGENEDGYECSECGAKVDEKFPNCPYCRARMKGADDD